MDDVKKVNNYHDYVIKDGEFIGEFEAMYQNCENPWPEDEHDLSTNPVASHTINIIKKYGFKKIFSVGSGKGLHANWLKENCKGISVEGCELSETAVNYSKEHYPDIKVHQIDLKEFDTLDLDFDLIIFREVLWYILPDWDFIVEVLKNKYRGKYVLVEISCYDDQKYGKEYFNGPEEIISKFPFKVKETVRHHVTPMQKEGMISVFGEI